MLLWYHADTMGRIILITTLLCAVACKPEPEGFDYKGPELTCDCDDDDAAKQLMAYNICVIAQGKHMHAQCFDVACKSVCPIEIDSSDFE